MDDAPSSLPYWEAANEVLAWPAQPARIVQPRQVVTRLRPLVRKTGTRIGDAGLATKREPLSGVRDVAAGARPEDVFPSAAAFAEAIALVRCIQEERDGVDELITMRAYLDSAVVPAGRPALVVDHAATREQLSFIALLIEPHRSESMRAAFETFRSTFCSAYGDHHARYWKASGKLARTLGGLAPAARALERLNSLRALGPAVGEDALVDYRTLSSGNAPCPASATRGALLDRPVCGHCGLTLNDTVPNEHADDVAHRLNSALAVQQRRLASEAVRRILARGGERLDRFVEIVQAADTASLAQVLDGELLVFLQELLAQPVSPTPEALHLFEQIALAHPVITEEQVDLVVETLRGLLREQLAAQRSDDRSRPPSFYLATPP